MSQDKREKEQVATASRPVIKYSAWVGAVPPVKQDVSTLTGSSVAPVSAFASRFSEQFSELLVRALKKRKKHYLPQQVARGGASQARARGMLNTALQVIRRYKEIVASS